MRYLRFIILTIALQMCLACVQGEAKLGVPEEKLIDVLCDIHIMEAALQNRPTNQKDSVAEVYYNQVYEKHDLSEEVFLETLKSMEANPKLLSNIYSKVLVQLDTMEQKSFKDKYKKK